MFQKTLDHFKTITTKPHCSFETTALAEHLISESKRMGFEVQTDKAGNIIARKGNPKICLQSHYDMVGMGDAPKIEIYEEDGWLKAKNSSLGADNGIGIAISLALMETKTDLECLFTNDEEVGMIGAENLELEIKAPNLLNLDTEDEGDVIIGCAGGIDIWGRISLEKEPLNENLQGYEIVVSGLPGGHSGMEIAKNIPSAIKVLGRILVKNNCKIVEIEGGEKNNSIAQNARALVFSAEDIKSCCEHVSVKKVDISDKKVLKNSCKIKHMINAFSQGVRAYDEELGLPRTSINISTMRSVDGKLAIEFFGRSMVDEEMEKLKSEMKSFLEGFSFDVTFENPASSWKPVKTDFALKVKDICDKHLNKVKISAVHAGLECGTILKKQPQIKGVCSIGPNIRHPHSTQEKCEIATVERVVKIVEEIVNTL